MILTRFEEVSHPQKAKGDSHDGGFVQMGGDSAGEWEGVGELVKHLSLLTSPTSGRITGMQLPLLQTAPRGSKEGGGRQRRRETEVEEETG